MDTPCTCVLRIIVGKVFCVVTAVGNDLWRNYVEISQVTL